MAVSDGQRANQQTFNDAFLSRTQDSDTVSVVGLNHPTSGPLIPDAQQKINDIDGATVVNAGAIAILDATKQNISEKDMPGGYPGLDADGRISPQALPFEAVEYQGTWDASTNTPALSDGVGDIGDLFRVNAAGTQTFNGVATEFEIGDVIIYNGTVWERNLGSTIGSIDDLNDVDITTTAINDGQGLVWDATNNQFVPGSASGRSNIQLIAPSPAAVSYDDTSNQLTLSNDIFVLLPGAAPGAHTIEAQSLALGASGADVVYIQTDIANADGTVVPLMVSDAISFADSPDKVIVAVREGSELFFGITDPQRVSDGETVSLQAGSSVVQTNVIQENILSLNVTANGTIGELTFNNLSIGKTYHLRGHVRLVIDVAEPDITATLNVVHSGSIIDQKSFTINEASNTGNDSVSVAFNQTFVATSTVLEFEAQSASPGSVIVGNGSRGVTLVQIEERNDLLGPIIPQSQLNRTAPLYIESPDFSFNTLSPVIGAWHDLEASWFLNISPGVWDLEATVTMQSRAVSGTGFNLIALTNAANAAAHVSANTIMSDVGPLYTTTRDLTTHRLRIRNYSTTSNEVIRLIAFIGNFAGLGGLSEFSLRNNLFGSLGPAVISARKIADV